jgi:hypothetical protein
MPCWRPQANIGNKVMFIGWSQGHLHCIVKGHRQCPCHWLNRYRKKWRSHGLSIWVLRDMDTQECVFKHKVSCEQLFGNRIRTWDGLVDYHVVTMHPDCNMVFFHPRHRDGHPMISYDFDRQQVCVWTPINITLLIRLFFLFHTCLSYFLESLVLTNEHYY